MSVLLLSPIPLTGPTTVTEPSLQGTPSLYSGPPSPPESLDSYSNSFFTGVLLTPLVFDHRLLRP